MGIRKSESGVTLVELMVSVALFGMMALGMMTVLTEQAKLNFRHQNEVDLSDGTLEFLNAIEIYLGNTTQVIACGCGNKVTNQEECIFDDSQLKGCIDSAQCKNDGTNSVTLLRFETETAQDPEQAAGDGCLYGDKNSGATDSMVLGKLADGVTDESITLRGCKKRMRLIFNRPTLTDAGAKKPSQAGTLTLSVENADGTRRVLHELKGVYDVYCGYPSSTQGQTTKIVDRFRIVLKAKAKLSNSPFGAVDYETWHPEDGAIGAYGFNRGQHRQYSVDTSFRNLSTPGVIFGRPFSMPNCVPDRGSADDIFSSDGNCCSGYRTLSNGFCTVDCKKAGDASAEEAECCSHMRNPSTGECL